MKATMPSSSIPIKNISLPLLLCTEDDVVGNHRTSAGQLDANTIYFLMTRGFSLEEARESLWKR